jgi:PAS domain S-box-containing protein
LPPNTELSLALALAHLVPEHLPALSADLTRCETDGLPFERDLELITAKGRHRWIRAIGEGARDAGGRIIAIRGAFTDISDRKRAELETRRIAGQLESTLDSLSDAIFTLDLEWRFTYINAKAERLLRRPRAELIGRVVWDEFKNEELDVFRRNYRLALDERRTVEFEYDDAEQAHWYEFRVSPMDGGLTVFVRDITNRRTAENELARLNRALRLLTACSEALIHVTDERELLHEVCRLAVETGGYRTAWVGYARQDEGKSVDTVAVFGEGRAYFDGLGVSWAPDVTAGQGPTGRTVRSGQPVVTEDFSREQTMAHRLARAIEYGFHGSVNLPLRDGDRTFGVLGLMSGEVRHVGSEEMALLREMTDDLAFGILNIRALLERQRLHAALDRLAESAVAGVGGEFFAHLAGNMAEALDADACVVARILPSNLARAVTLAVVIDGATKQNFEYELAGSPCARVVSRTGALVIDEIGTLFPGSELIADVGARTCVGECLYNALGEPAGLIYALFKEGDARSPFVMSTMHVFAVRAAAEVDRQASESRLREQASLLDRARDSIVVKDLQHRITYWNKSAELLYGWTAEEVIGRSTIDFLCTDVDLLKAATRTVTEVGEWQGELTQKTRNGDLVTVEARWTLVRDQTGTPTGILSIKTDVTQRKKLEQQFFRAQRLESIGTLAGGIAHDLNNVLTPIVLAIDLLRMSVHDPDGIEILDTIAVSANRGADMVRQVLSFARGMDGRRLDVQPQHLVQEIEKIVRETFSRQIAVRTFVASNLWSIVGDANQLHQVLLNLCVNARDAMPNGGELMISAENMMLDEQYAAMNIEAKVGPYVALQVEDTGAGIPAAIVEKIFDPFFTTKELTKGTGLGLSTSSAIVKSHGGFMRVYSEAGRGSRFCVYLPAELAKTSSGEAAELVEYKRGQGELVLVVDDEAAIRQVTKSTLESFGYRVIVATDGAEALALYVANAAEIAVVLTDMMMPIMDGVATIHALMRINPNVRIVAASGISANGTAARATGAGVRYFLPKPYTADSLLDVLWRALTEQPPATQA